MSQNQNTTPKRTDGAHEPARSLDTLSRRHFLGAVIAPSVSAMLGTVACSDAGGGGGVDVAEDIGLDIDVGLDIPPSPGDSSDTPVDPPDWTYEELVAAYFGDADMSGIRGLGRAYLREFDGEESIEQDLAVLLSPLLARRTLDDAVSRCEELVADEFDELDVHLLSGWVMAPTEMRLCALAEVVA